MYRFTSLTTILVMVCILVTLIVHTMRSTRAVMTSYNSKIQERYMTKHTRSRDIVVFMYIPPYGQVDSCTLTLYSIVLLSYCPFRVRTVVVHADDDHSAELANNSVHALMCMLRQRNMVNSVCRHVEDHTVCMPSSVVSSESIKGHFSYGAIVRAGVLMVPQWDKQLQDNVSNAAGLYACWPQTVEHTYHHIASKSDSVDRWMARAKQYIDLTFVSGVDNDADTRPLFPQLVFDKHSEAENREVDTLLPRLMCVPCLGNTSMSCHIYFPEQSVFCSSSMCFGPYKMMLRYCPILSVLCMAKISSTHLDILLSAYLHRTHGTDEYLIPQSLLCRTFDNEQNTDTSDIEEVYKFLYSEGEGDDDNRFLKKHLAFRAESADRRQRMMGLMKGSREEIRLKYHSMEGYIKAYRERLRKDRSQQV